MRINLRTDREENQKEISDRPDYLINKPSKLTNIQLYIIYIISHFMNK